MFTLSIILNIHRKADLLEKTIYNLQTIINTNQTIKNTWKNVEIIAILDNSDSETKTVVSKHKELFSQIDEVDFGDLALSRNYGVEKSINNFILFADGDDYFSHDTLDALYQVFYDHYQKIMHTSGKLDYLDETQHIAVFPHYYIEFPNMLQAEYFDSTEFTIQNNKFLHCFGSRIAVHKNLLLKHQLHADTAPYGYEDWDLNNRLLAHGVQFKIAEYKLYYRRGDAKSLLALQVEKKNIVRNSLLYDYAMINKNPKNSTKETNQTTALCSNNNFHFLEDFKSQTLRKIYLQLKHDYIKNQKVDSCKDKSIFIEDITFLKSYGETVQPREDLIYYSLEKYSLELSTETKIYNQIMEFLLNKEVVYFFPWVVIGGADRVSVSYTKLLSQKNSCVITNICKGERINQINIPHLDLISEVEGWKNISEDDQLHVLTKAIINSHIQLVHVVNSEIMIKSLKYYSKLYKEYQVKTIISLFCPEYDWHNKQWHGFPVMYPEVFNNTDLVLLDNHYWYNFFKTLNKGKDFNYQKLSSPTEERDISYRWGKDDTHKILWASRICNQKLFSIFEEIVNLLPEYTFIVYGAVTDEDQHNKSILDRLIKKENIEFRGTYQDIKEIDLNEFDLYLFTSLYEGIPTIILDMIMSGIPIVSAKVGGISEVLGERYPLLVKDESNATEYVNKINEFYIIKNTLEVQILDIRQNILKNHNEQNFKTAYNSYVNALLNATTKKGRK